MSERGIFKGSTKVVTKSQNEPHKYAPVIKAWANGKKIQYSVNNREWWDFPSDGKTSAPNFNMDSWRVKKEEETEIVNINATKTRFSFAEVLGVQPNLRLTFVDGVLVGADVL